MVLEYVNVGTLKHRRKGLGKKTFPVGDQDIYQIPIKLWHKPAGVHVLKV